ncbi:MAG TPA: hypothetical protein VGJ25_03180 [Gaiellaceae bacterium]|jgi:hypothetical protein
MTRQRSLPFMIRLSSSGRVVDDDPLAGADELWADEDFGWTAEEPVWVPHPDSLGFFRGLLLAVAISLVIWVALAGIGFGVYRLVS